MARLADKFQDRALGKTAPDTGFNPLAPKDTLTELPLDQVRPDPDQPRKDMGDLSELMESLKSTGLVQPIIVRAVAYNDFQIIAGERRYSAMKALGETKILAIVRTVEEQQKLEYQIVENLHRKDLNPLEEAQSYRRLMDEFGLTQDALGGRLGKSPAAVNETLRLLELPDAIQSDLRTSEESRRISKSLLLEIAKLPGADQDTLWQAAKRGELTVKEARARKQATTQSVKPAATPKEASFRHVVQTGAATVTLTFPKATATGDDILLALEEALRLERARLEIEHDRPATGDPVPSAT